jgi:hypothetical protein
MDDRRFERALMRTAARFDQGTRHLAPRPSRRRVLRGLGAVLGAAPLAALTRTGSVAADPGKGHACKGKSGLGVAPVA